MKDKTEKRTILLVKEDTEADNLELKERQEYGRAPTEHIIVRKTDICEQIQTGLSDVGQTRKDDQRWLSDEDKLSNHKSIALSGCAKKFHSAAEINECRTLCIKEIWANLDSEEIVDEEEINSENEMDENDAGRGVVQIDDFKENGNEDAKEISKIVQKLDKQDSLQSVYKNLSKAERQKQFLIRKYFLFKAADQQKQFSVLPSSHPRPALISASNFGR